MEELLFATTNHGKCQEIQQAAHWLGRTIKIRSLTESGWGHLPVPVETGNSYQDIARQKAHYYAEATGSSVLADDGGLELQGFPQLLGVETQRFFSTSDPQQQNRELLALWECQPHASRKCTLTSTLVLVTPEREWVASARQEAFVVPPRGTDGYGFDRVLARTRTGRTFAEMSVDERFRLSPRVQAFEKMLRQLKEQMK